MKHNNGILLLLLIVCSLIVFCSSASIDSDLSRNQDISNAIVNAIAGSPSLMTSNKKVSSSSNNEPPQSSELTAEQANTISVIMQTMLPSMFGLFSNITTDEFKSHFQDPCRFDVLMDIFKNLPPYFDEIAKKYPNKHDLIAYYSMQLASTFLVNNGSLTMACMYNMLSLQTKLFSFSLDIMDNPEKNPQLVGLFGIFMKPVMGLLKKNSMMKIIEHVDRYDKNDDMSTIPLFHFLNFVYVFLGIFAILSNILLVILLKRSSAARCQKPTIVHTQSILMNNTNTNNTTLTRKSNNMQSEKKKLTNVDIRNTTASSSVLKSSSTTAIMHKTKRRTRKSNKKISSATYKYKTIKSNNARMFYMIRKRYKTRFCFIIIAICHSFYILVNFMIMSQASLAAAALKGLSQLNLACKFAFFMSPPTTVYNIVHQLAIWLLVYAIRQHATKLRRTRTFNVESAGDYEIEMMKSDYDDDDEDDDQDQSDNEKVIDSDYNEKDIYESNDDEDTVSVSLTNNSNNLVLISQSAASNNLATNQQGSSVVKFKITPDAPSYTNYHQILNHQRHPIIQFTPNATQNISKLPMITPHPTVSSDALIPSSVNLKKKSIQQNNESLSYYACYLFSHKRRNVLFCLILFMLICLYDSQNFFLYSLSELTKDGKTIYFCAFESNYADYYTLLNQYILPITNLCLFSFFPLFLCTMQVLFDACFLVRVQREQMKRYERLKDVIEWPLYAYYAVYMISQIPLLLHQIVDLASGTVKFPFVFPIFIQLKFTSKVWLNVIEMTLMFLCYSSDLYIWMLCDKQMRRLAAYWLNKRIFCRTYKQKGKKNETNTSKNNNSRRACGGSSSSGNIDGSTSVGSSHSTSSSEGFSCNRSDSSVNNKKEHKNRIYKKPQQIMTKNNNNKKSSSTGIELEITNQNNNINNNSSGVSTVSSSASSSSNLNKKQISPIISAAADTAAATAKAAAAISASMSQQQQQQQTIMYESGGVKTKNFKMIDTDNDDIDDIIDLDGQAKLAKLYEEKELDTSTMNRVYADKPPSFNTAMRSRNEKISNNNHQYQNSIDTNQINGSD
jgi:hypothetical protein